MTCSGARACSDAHWVAVLSYHKVGEPSPGAWKTWWFNYDYALGFIAGWGVHPLDIAYWGHPAMMKGPMSIEGKVIIAIPEIAENGNTVPITISVNSPMTDVDHVKAIHIIATANPNAYVAGFRFTPLSGKASVSTRIRLASTQEVISVAELGDGKFLIGRRQVKVTIGGCGGDTP